MIHQRCASYVLVVAVLTLALSPDRDAAAQRNDDKKPSLSLKATPPVGFSPLKVRLVVDVSGGADDCRRLLLPDHRMGMGRRPDVRELGGLRTRTRRARARSGAATRTEHTYRYEGNFTARFRMKQGKRVVASTTVNVQVRAGVRDDIDQ